MMNYYVSAQDGDKTTALLGPFPFHAMALAMVGPAQRYAIAYYNKNGIADFAAYGTSKINIDPKIEGKFNHVWGLPCSNPQPVSPERRQELREAIRLAICIKGLMAQGEAGAVYDLLHPDLNAQASWMRDIDRIHNFTRYRIRPGINRFETHWANKHFKWILDHCADD